MIILVVYPRPELVAIDKQLDLFSRAWCVAQIVAARRLGLTQTVMLHSKAVCLENLSKLVGVLLKFLCKVTLLLEGFLGSSLLLLEGV